MRIGCGETQKKDKTDMNRRDALKSGIGSLIAGSHLLAQEEASAKRGGTTDATHWTAESDVIWTTPSKDASGSLPLGNGEVGINLWVEDGGDRRYMPRTLRCAKSRRINKGGFQ